MRLIVLACILGLLGCNQPERLASSTPADPRRSWPQVDFEPIELEPMVLRTHADYDAWENKLLARGGATLVYTLYQQAMTHKRGNQRTFTRWMLMSLHEEVPEELRQRVRPFVDAMSRNVDNMSADVRYLLGELAWRRLSRGSSSVNIALDVRNTPLVDTVTANWEALLTSEPDWVGPHGITAGTIRARLDSLKDSLAPPPPLAADKTVTGDIGLWILERVEATGKAAGLASKDAQKLRALQEAGEAFRRHYEDQGSRIACDELDAALEDLNHPALLGEGVAHCALDRNNPFEAIDQVRRMTTLRIPGGIPAVLNRLEVLARSNSALAAELTQLRQYVTAAVKEAPQWAQATGIDRWLIPTP